MTTVEMKVDALCRLVLGESYAQKESVKEDLIQLMQSPSVFDAEGVVHEHLNNLGVPCGILGHQYLVYAILKIAEDPHAINDITGKNGLYKSVSNEFGVTASQAERSIRHAIETAWRRGDITTLNRYFGNTIDAEKGKPTNTEFIARLANIVRLRLNP